MAFEIKRPGVPGLITILVLAVVACREPNDSFRYGEPRDFLADVDAEAEHYRADMEFFADRRRAYEEHGVVPTVPPSLSSDPQDPEYRFRGYMHIATEEEEEADRIRLLEALPVEPSPEELAAGERPLHEDEVVGVFVNEAGEMWAWSPGDLEARLRKRRAARGDASVRSVDDSHQLREEVEADWARARFGSGALHAEVLGADNRAMRSAYSGHNMTAYPWRVLGSLETNGKPTGQTPLGRCTASKIGERYLLTAAHCVFAEGGGIGSLKTRDWWPGADGIDALFSGGDPTPNYYKNILWYYTDEKYVVNGWDTRDYAVLVLYDNASSCSFGSLGYRVDNSLAGSSYWSFGHPWYTNQCPPASPIADDWCMASMWGMSAEIDSTSASYVFHDHDTQGGQSGSPIYDYNGGNRQIVALVKGDYSQWDNRGIKIRGRVFDFIEAVRDEQPSTFCTY